MERVIGLTPTMGGTQRLAARAGVGRAKEFVFTGDLYDAATMERWNVVNRVLPVEGFDDAALAFVEHIATGPTKAFGAAKDVLRHFEAGGVPEANAHVTAIAAELFDTAGPAGRHGVIPPRRPRQGHLHRPARPDLGGLGARTAAVARCSAQKLTNGIVPNSIVVMVNGLPAVPCGPGPRP